MRSPRNRARVWFYILWLGVKATLRFNLGDIVIYLGREYRLLQGVRSPLWELGAVDKSGVLVRDAFGRLEIVEVHSWKFRKKRTLRSYWGSFTFGYRFFMGYYYRIWVEGAPM